MKAERDVREEMLSNRLGETHFMLPINHSQHFLSTYPAGGVIMRKLRFREVICLKSRSKKVAWSRVHTLNSILYCWGVLTRSVGPGTLLPTCTCS